MNDELAAKIMRKLSGCNNVTEFQALNANQRNTILLDMLMARVSAKQASRITGVSYGVVRKVVSQALQATGCTLRPGIRGISTGMITPGMITPRGFPTSHDLLSRHSLYTPAGRSLP